MIKAVKIIKTYRQGRSRIEAVKEASLEIERGESLLIAGPSGAGKSTLIHLLGGLDLPTGGRLFIDGADFSSLSDRRRASIRNEKVGFVFQFYHLLPEFTVFENVILPALMRRRNRSRLREIKLRGYELLETVGLRERASHTPRELSGGESQRVAIARSLMNRPEILFADEPTGNLDSRMGGEIIECLWRLKEKESMAFVVVTHDERISFGFDKTFIMTDGRIEESNDGARSLPEWQICR